MCEEVVWGAVEFEAELGDGGDAEVGGLGAEEFDGCGIGESALAEVVIGFFDASVGEDLGVELEHGMMIYLAKIRL